MVDVIPINTLSSGEFIRIQTQSSKVIYIQSEWDRDKDRERDRHTERDRLREGLTEREREHHSCIQKLVCPQMHYNIIKLGYTWSMRINE